MRNTRFQDYRDASIFTNTAADEKQVKFPFSSNAKKYQAATAALNIMIDHGFNLPGDDIIRSIFSYRVQCPT